MHGILLDGLLIDNYSRTYLRCSPSTNMKGVVEVPHSSRHQPVPHYSMKILTVLMTLVCIVAPIQCASRHKFHSAVSQKGYFRPLALGLRRTSISGEYTGAGKGQWPAGPASKKSHHPMRLEYWWRLRCLGDGSMQLRGVGSGYSASTPFEHEVSYRQE
jgi:hypothetical protein